MDALLKRHESAEEWRNFRAALPTWAVVACNTDPKKRQWKVDDFMPRKGKTTAPHRMSDEEMLNMARVLNAQMGGKVI